MRYAVAIGICVSVIVALWQAVAAAQPAAASSSGANAEPACVLYASDYGGLCPGSDGAVTLWWCDATRKIARTRPAPQRPGEAVRLASARNEFEAVQLVVRPNRALAGLTASVSDLRGPEGATIPASQISLLRVRYVKVRVPTDKTGVADEWPDPLPPFDKPMDVPAGVNQPIWVLVHVPKTAVPGDYQARISLAANDWSASVPLTLHVWAFALPDEPYTQSAFGLSMGNPYRYQNVTRPEDRRALFEKYMQSFADHRISPYDPVPFDPMEIKFRTDVTPPRAEIRFDRFDAAMERAIARWHITSFILHLPGMGGGTFEARHEGELAGHKAGSPEYEAMFSSIVRQIESHLREKGWLEKAYIYWFDEPEPKDYAFVRAGMERLKKYAPGLRRMLTEEPVEPLFGAVDLWCPLTPNYNHDLAEKRRANGEQFWWYVCCGPHAPFCGLFIDHAATDLRVWLWQTWQRRISGILIWETAWWTSPTAFPDSIQNPYEDPMSYRTSGTMKPGTKEYWGNGDGRFLYPPESAAGGSKTPVLDGPVSCIRWEMLRDGVEDADYLHLLDVAIRANRVGADEAVLRQARALLDVPPGITRSAKEFSLDSSPIYERRAAVAAMIERLRAKSPRSLSR
jgi:hypothetical protein